MKQNVLFVFFVAMLVVGCNRNAYYPSSRDITVHTDTTMITAQLPIKKLSVSVRNNKLYHWYSNGVIGFNYGGYKGYPLHGEYVVQTKEGILVVKGSFLAGVKDGDWKHWDCNGQLAHVERWDKGVLKKTLLDSTNNSNPIDSKVEQNKGSVWYKFFSRRANPEEKDQGIDYTPIEEQIDSTEFRSQVEEISE
jgi:hypothetical protein